MYILLVEEDHFYASMIMGLLKKSGFDDIKHIDNGIDCLLQVYEDVTPDLVIMDSHLGRVNGVEVLQKLLTHKPGLKVVLMSSQPNGKKINESLKDAVLDVIMKDEMVYEHLLPFVEQIQKDVIQKRRNRPVTNLLVNFKRFILAP
ncbi:MAG: response regulator [Bacteroidetes bacterium]|nr:response regulator [Bacteroidota bacterium]